MYLAANPVVPLEQLKKFSLREEKSIHEALAANETIDDALFEMLLGKEKDVVKFLLWYQPISQDRFRMITEKVNDPDLLAELGKNRQIERAVIEELLESGNVTLLEKLAANRSISAVALQALYSKKIYTTFYPLAGNPNLEVKIIEAFYTGYHNDIRMMHQVASNPNTPEKILRELYECDELEINKGLAANPSTPIEILDVLKIDTRLRNALTQNEVFIEHHNTTKVVI